MRSVRRLLAALVVTTSMVAPRAGAAQSPPTEAEDAGAQAVALGREGVALYEAGKWDEAEKKFAAAEAKLHSPVFVLYIARAQRNTNRWLEARATLRKLAAEQVADDAPPPWKQAIADARGELAALEPTIPSIVVTSPGAPPSATVLVDGRVERGRASIEVDPGSHDVVVRDGAREERATIDIRSGERDRAIEIPWGASVGPTVPPASPERTETASGSGSVVPGVVVLGLGIAGLGVGGVTGAMALGASDDVQERCPGGACPASVTEADVADDRSRAGTLADVSTISFIAGGVLAAAGVVLIVVRPFGGDEAAITASPGGATFRGSF